MKDFSDDDWVCDSKQNGADIEEVDEVVEIYSIATDNKIQKKAEIRTSDGRGLNIYNILINKYGLRQEYLITDSNTNEMLYTGVSSISLNHKNLLAFVDKDKTRVTVIDRKTLEVVNQIELKNTDKEEYEFSVNLATEVTKLDVKNHELERTSSYYVKLITSSLIDEGRHLLKSKYFTLGLDEIDIITNDKMLDIEVEDKVNAKYCAEIYYLATDCIFARLESDFIKEVESKNGNKERFIRSTITCKKLMIDQLGKIISEEILMDSNDLLDLYAMQEKYTKLSTYDNMKDGIVYNVFNSLFGKEYFVKISDMSVNVHCSYKESINFKIKEIDKVLSGLVESFGDKRGNIKSYIEQIKYVYKDAGLDAYKIIQDNDFMNDILVTDTTSGLAEVPSYIAELRFKDKYTLDRFNRRGISYIRDTNYIEGLYYKSVGDFNADCDPSSEMNKNLGINKVVKALMLQIFSCVNKDFTLSVDEFSTDEVVEATIEKISFEEMLERLKEERQIALNRFLETNKEKLDTLKEGHGLNIIGQFD